VVSVTRRAPFDSRHSKEAESRCQCAIIVFEEIDDIPAREAWPNLAGPAEAVCEVNYEVICDLTSSLSL
jgi:hypothetical protein